MVKPCFGEFDINRWKRCKGCKESKDCIRSKAHTDNFIRELEAINDGN